MKFVIISKDRACQADALIRSMRRFENLSRPEIYVIYGASTEVYARGYERLKLINQNVRRIQGSSAVKVINDNGNIRHQLKHIMDFMDDTTCLLTDDCIFFRNPDVCTNYIGRELKNNHNLYSFSYRLGLNTVVQDYIRNIEQPKIQHYKELDDSNTITYNYKHFHPETNYGLHFGWDGMCYETKVLKGIFKLNDISNYISNHHAIYPQQVENFKARQRDYEKKELMACNKHSSLICMNYNSTHPHAPFNSYPLEFLNDKFLNGYQINLDSIDFSNINSCHQNFKFDFEKINEEYLASDSVPEVVTFNGFGSVDFERVRRAIREIRRPSTDIVLDASNEPVDNDLGDDLDD
jgi:hypothetical protein